MMDQRALHNRKGAPADNRQLIVLDRNVETVLIHSRHFNFELVAIAGFNHARWRRDKLFDLRAVTVTVFTS